MNPEILIVAADRSQGRVLCRLLNKHQFRTLPLASLAELEEYLATVSSRTVIIDLDSLPADPRFFKRMGRSHPSVNLLVMSQRSFHPELREVLAEQIFASVKKPLDPDEIVFLLRSIENNRHG